MWGYCHGGGGGCPPGHVVKKVNGVKGVVVPGTESGGPWKLQRGFASCVVHEQEHDCDSDADPAAVQRKFDDLCEAREAAVKAAVVGMMASVLEQCAHEATEEDKKVLKRRRGKAETPSAAHVGESLSSKRPLAGRGLGGCVSDDSVDAPTSAKRRPQAKAYAYHRHAPSGGAAQPAEGASKSGANAIAADDASCDSEAARRRGRPAKSVEDVIRQLRAQFVTAGEESIFFGERAGTQLRCLNRYAVQAGQKLLGAAGRGLEPVFEKARKECQVMEHGVKLALKWKARKSPQIGVQEFLPAWHQLQTFCESDPRTPLKCHHLSLLYFQVLCSDLQTPDFPAELHRAKVQSCLPTLASSMEEVAQLQRRLVTEACIFRLATLPPTLPTVGSAGQPARLDTSTASGALLPLLDCLLKEGNAGEFSKDLLQEARELRCLLQEPNAADLLDSEVAEQLRSALQAVGDGQGPDPPRLAQLLMRYPASGQAILGKARANLQSMSEHQAYQGHMEACTRTMDSMLTEPPPRLEISGPVPAGEVLEAIAGWLQEHTRGPCPQQGACRVPRPGTIAAPRSLGN